MAYLDICIKCNDKGLSLFFSKKKRLDFFTFCFSYGLISVVSVILISSVEAL